MKKIDIIIPIYNIENDYLFRCLSSIACQNNLKNLEITIVDDASNNQDYEKIVNIFKDYIKINILKLSENKGPGVARQYGLDNTQNDYIVFIDADDTLNGSFALSALVEGLEQSKDFQICVGIFDEIQTFNEETLILPHERDLVWIFGKIYRRNFLKQNDIKFHNTSRANEDNGFNQLCRLCMNSESQINFISAHVYYWHNNENSITRINNCQYSYGSGIRDSFYGYVENMIYSIKEAKKRNPYNPLIMMQSVNVMFNLYEYYLECLDRAPQHSQTNFKWCKWYYNEIYSKIEDDISDDLFKQHYTMIMKNAYINNQLNNIIPKIDIYNFLNKLKEKDEEN